MDLRDNIIVEQGIVYIYVRVFNVIMKKEDEMLRRVYLRSIFRNDDNFKTILPLIKENHELFADIYLFSIGDLYDLESKKFLELFKLNRRIIFDLCDTLFSGKEQSSYRRAVNFDFSFIWNLDKEIIFEVVDYIIKNYCQYNFSDNIEKLFNCKRNKEIYSYQDELILDYFK